jgi:hypothetical protein
MTSENEARAALEREVYWAEDATPRSRVDTGEVRDLLHDFSVLVRADEKQAIPRGEPYIGSRSRVRRKAKSMQFLIFRPIRKRHDRLLADLGELTAALADRVVALEAEVKRLREQTHEGDG